MPLCSVHHNVHPWMATPSIKFQSLRQVRLELGKKSAWSLIDTLLPVIVVLPTPHSSSSSESLITILGQLAPSRR